MHSVIAVIGHRLRLLPLSSRLLVIHFGVQEVLRVIAPFDSFTYLCVMEKLRPVAAIPVFKVFHPTMRLKVLLEASTEYLTN